METPTVTIVAKVTKIYVAAAFILEVSWTLPLDVLTHPAEALNKSVENHPKMMGSTCFR